MEEIFAVLVRIEDTINVKGSAQTVSFVSFSGEAKGKYFNGIVLRNAVDTQKFDGSTKKLSARYVLEGVDCAGRECRIFIENTADSESEYTSPEITTDSQALSWLESAELVGKIDCADNGDVVIHILKKSS